MSDIKNKTILIIGAGLLQLPAIEAANKMGLRTVVVDGDPNAVGVKSAEYFIHSSTLSAETTADKAEIFHNSTQNIDGVLTVGTDATLTVAVCSKRLGLAGIDPETAIKATDKYQMRKALRLANAPVPDFEVVDTYHKSIEIYERLEGDCVIKPLKNMGARGVKRVTSLDELKEAFELAMSYSSNRQVIIEKYIDSPELSIDALIYENEIIITGVADRIIEYNPYFVETGHIMPSKLSDGKIKFAIETFKKGIRALGINTGAAKGDIKVSSSACFIGEIAARLSGGFMSAYTYPYSTGVDLMKNIILIALGKPPEDIEPKKNWVSIERAIIAPPGIIKEIEGIDKAKNIEYVKNIFFDCRIGDRVEFPKNNLDKCGHLIVAAPTRLEALTASHKAMRLIKIRTVEDDDQLIENKFLIEIARNKFNGRCFVCEDCNGISCRGMLPGVGGVGTGLGFIRSIERMRMIDIYPQYINDAKTIDTTIDFFGLPLDSPIIPAPITGSITNLGGAITELRLARAIVKGANHAGSVGFVGDGATPTKFKIGLQVVLENFGMAVPIFKPRFDLEMIKERIAAAKEAGAIAVGMDIDAASFKTMEMKGQSTSAKSFEELKELVDFAGIPFILKGILSPKDAELAIKAGVKGIIVSNHGGRVSDSLISPIDALPGIKKAVGNEAFIILDGGIRSGSDVLKSIILGADAAMIGRPIMIAAVGGEIQGVRQYIQRIHKELKKAMIFVGIDSAQKLKGRTDILFYR